MQTPNLKLLLTVVLSTALVVGCGGGGGGSAAPAPDISQSVSAVLDFINRMIADTTSETTEPVDISAITLAVDDTAEPVAL